MGMLVDGHLPQIGLGPSFAQSLVIALLVVVGAAVVVRFEQSCLRELAQTPEYQLRLFTRTGWITLIVLCIPFGGLLFMSAGRWQ